MQAAQGDWTAAQKMENDQGTVSFYGDQIRQVKQRRMTPRSTEGDLKLPRYWTR
jgi:hypothetical protein